MSNGKTHTEAELRGYEDYAKEKPLIEVRGKEMTVDGGSLPKGTYVFHDTVVLEGNDTMVSAVRQAMKEGTVEFVPALASDEKEA